MERVERSGGSDGVGPRRIARRLPRARRRLRGIHSDADRVVAAAPPLRLTTLATLTADECVDVRYGDGILGAPSSECDQWHHVQLRLVRRHTLVGCRELFECGGRQRWLSPPARPVDVEAAVGSGGAYRPSQLARP